MKRIDGDKVGTYDGIITIYKGFDENAKIRRFILSASGDKSDLFISLNDCLHIIGYRGFGDYPVTVIIDTALHGEIYTFGNNGDYWVETGKSRGYA